MRSCFTENQICSALNSLPLTLGESYERILRSMGLVEAPLARAALEFVVFSKRPLTLAELAEAVAVGPHDEPFDIRNRMFKLEDILRICSSLLVLEHPDLDNPKTDHGWNYESTISRFGNSNLNRTTVKPAHYTVSEYMQSTQIRSSPAKFFAMSRDSGDASLAKICLKYLLIFNDSEPPGATVDEEYPLVGYAAEFWHKHVTNTVMQRDAVTRDLLAKFLDTKGFCFLNCIRLYNPDSFIHGDRKNLDLQPGNMVSPLYYLCKLGACCELVKFAAVDMHFDANEQGDSGSALVAACHHCDDADTLRVLLVAGAEVNALGGYYGTALAATVRRCFEEGVTLLLGHGADPNLPQSAGYHDTVLHSAVDLDQDRSTDSQSAINILRKLLRAGAKIDAGNFMGETALGVAARKRFMGGVRILLEKGADVNWSNNGYKTPLQNAAASGDIEMVKYLLRARANVNAVDGSGETALIAAVKAEKIHRGERLLETGAGMNLAETTSGGRGGLLRGVAWSGNVELLNILLGAGADVNAVDFSGGTALIAAAKAGKTPIVERLLEAGAGSDDWGGLLRGVAWSGNVELLNILLDRGADAESIKDGTALRAAAIAGEIDMVKRLIQAGAEVNSTETSFAGVLQGAARYRRIDVLDFLIGAGAVVNSRDAYGQTVLEVAATSGNSLMVQQLLQAGATPNSVGTNGLYAPPLHEAAKHGHVDASKVLLEAGADVNLIDYLGLTAMGYACIFGRRLVVRLLLAAQADPNVSMLANWTPLAIAASKGFIAIVNCLLGAGADLHFVPRCKDERARERVRKWARKRELEWEREWEREWVHERVRERVREQVRGWRREPQHEWEREQKRESGREHVRDMVQELQYGPQYESVFEAALSRWYRDISCQVKVSRRAQVVEPHEILKRLLVAAPMLKDAKRSASEQRSGKKATARLTRRASGNDIVVPEGASYVVSWHARAESAQFS
jgi:ankyrin repeat protein